MFTYVLLVARRVLCLIATPDVHSRASIFSIIKWMQPHTQGGRQCWHGTVDNSMYLCQYYLGTPVKYELIAKTYVDAKKVRSLIVRPMHQIWNIFKINKFYLYFLQDVFIFHNLSRTSPCVEGKNWCHSKLS